MSQVIVKRKEELTENELIHSDVYLGEDYTDGLMHFKYVSKEKVNGKWRYYYKDKSYDGYGDSAIYEKKIRKR